MTFTFSDGFRDPELPGSTGVGQAYVSSGIWGRDELLEERSDVALLAHELTHVLQFQILQATNGPIKGAAMYLAAGAVDQVRLKMGWGNPYTGAGFLEPMAQETRRCFMGASCSGSAFTPPEGG